MKETKTVLPIDDSLIELGFAYKNEKPWKNLWNTHIFAIKDPFGGIDYCCVLGWGGEQYGLAVYLGQIGLDSYRRMLTEPLDFQNDMELQEFLLCQDCIMFCLDNKDKLHPRNVAVVRDYCKRTGKVLRGKNAYLGFERYRPGFQPWHITEDSEAEILKFALEAALEVSNQLKHKRPEELGFIETAEPGSILPLLTKNKNGKFQWEQTILPNTAETVFPKAVLDDISAVRLKKKRKNHTAWGVHLFRHLEAANVNEFLEDDMPFEAPFFPYALLIVDEKKGIVAHWELAEEPGIDVKRFSRTLIEAIDELGRPDIFYCIDDRTAAFMSDFSKKIGIKVLKREEDPYIEDVLDEFAMQFGSFDDDDDEFMNEMMDGIFEILSDPKALAELPDELLLSLKPMISDMPLVIQNNLRSEISKRHSRKR